MSNGTSYFQYEFAGNIRRERKVREDLRQKLSYIDISIKHSALRNMSGKVTCNACGVHILNILFAIQPIILLRDNMQMNIVKSHKKTVGNSNKTINKAIFY